jgi:hypothetical protein
MSETKSYIHWHIIGCVAFLLSPIFLSPRPPDMPILGAATYRDFLADAFMLGMFYFNFYWLIPGLYFKNRFTLYGCIIVAGFVVICIVPSLLTGYVPWDPKPPAANFPGSPMPDASFLVQIKHSIFLYIAIVLFSILLRVRTKLLQTESLRYAAEMSSLRNQINPHFLFNTLNNIYALAIKDKAHPAASGILKLSGMMRYVVTETGQPYVDLQQEINYTNDYIELQKMRLTKTLNLSYVVTGATERQRIAPLVLIPFIENAFKHGVNPDQESYISILIKIEDTRLSMTIENQKVKTVQELHTKSGVGIENTKSRLALLYPNKHFLFIDDNALTYRIQLNLMLA